jgi:hypothetical protein
MVCQVRVTRLKTRGRSPHDTQTASSGESPHAQHHQVTKYGCPTRRSETSGAGSGLALSLLGTYAIDKGRGGEDRDDRPEFRTDGDAQS